MPIMNNRKPSTHKKSAPFASRPLSRSTVQQKIPFLKEKNIPAGAYTATIVSVSESETLGGDEAVDIVYKLCDSNGRTFDVMERLIWNSRPFNALIDHLYDAGLLVGDSTVGDMVDICETVTVVYPYKNSIGSFQNRQPCQQKPVAPRKTVKQDLLAEDPDEEEDDYLDDED